MKKSLKTLLAAICAVLTLSLTACQKDAEELILGTWVENEAIYNFTQGGETESMSMLEPGETAEFTFNNDGTYTSIYHSVDGDAESIGRWSINDDMITMTDEFGPMAYHIDKLDKKAFNLTYTDSGEDEDGPYSMTIVMKMARK